MTKINLIALTTVIAISTTAFAQSTDSEAVKLEKDNSAQVLLGLNVASASINDAGGIRSDSLVFQPFTEISLNTFDPFPIILSTWANYATERYGAVMQGSCFTEIDFAIGTGYQFDNGISAAINLTTYQYPNVEGAKSEELIKTYASYCYSDLITLGLNGEFFVTGANDGGYNFIPYTTVTTELTKDVSVSLYGHMSYVHPDGDSKAGWAAYKLKAQIGFQNFYTFVEYYGQINDEIYTDEVHDDKNIVFGVGYSISL